MKNCHRKSLLRGLMSKSGKIKYHYVKNLEEAKNIKDTYLVMDGDEGGQIYVVCPVKKIKCSEGALRKLLKDIDKNFWNDLSMAGFYYEIYEPGSVVSGGKGGGRTENDLWVHEELTDFKDKIKAVLEGRADILEYCTE